MEILKHGEIRSPITLGEEDEPESEKEEKTAPEKEEKASDKKDELGPGGEPTGAPA